MPAHLLGESRQLSERHLHAGLQAKHHATSKLRGLSGILEKLTNIFQHDDESSLLSKVLCLWFAIRHTTASEYLCGPETLGMTPEQKDRSYPLFGKIPIAPVMGAQLELIMTLDILRPLRRQVLNQLQKMMAANKRKSWFTIYLSCFILLHSCSLATAWHYKYSRRNGVKVRTHLLESLVQNVCRSWQFCRQNAVVLSATAGTSVEGNISIYSATCV
jgi:hypothetical protein